MQALSALTREINNNNKTTWKNKKFESENLKENLNFYLHLAINVILVLIIWNIFSS